MHISSPVHATFPTHSVLLDLIILLKFGNGCQTLGREFRTNR